MEATDILKSEHRVIEGVLEVLETAARRLGEGQTVRPGLFLDAANFIQGFADGCHHRKEEGVLFVALAAHGLSEKQGPVGVMLMEHEQGRAYTRAMREAAQRLEAGDLSARAQIVEAALGYVGLLRAHIMKEDQILFTIADRVIPLDEQAQVARDFDRLEHEETGEGVHEKYLALAQALQEELVAVG